jgi:hypothetical protein
MVGGEGRQNLCCAKVVPILVAAYCLASKGGMSCMVALLSPIFKALCS